MEEENEEQIVVVKGRGVVEIIENTMKGFIKIESQGTFYDGKERGLTKVIIFIEREKREALFN